MNDTVSVALCHNAMQQERLQRRVYDLSELPSNDRTLAQFVWHVLQAEGLDWFEPVVYLDGQYIDKDFLAQYTVDARSTVRIVRGMSGGTELVLIGLALLSTAASIALAPKVSFAGVRGDESPESTRYAFSRFSSDAVAGGPIPVVFGHRPRYGGRVIAQVPGDDAENGDQVAKLLICLGHGPIKQIGNQTSDFDRLDSSQVTGVYLNDTPIEKFPGATVSGRFGAQNQSVIPGFDDIETVREVGAGGVTLRNTSGSNRTDPSASGEAYTYTTMGPVDAVVVRVYFPSGLNQVLDSAQLESRTVQYRVRTRLTAGPGAWSAWKTVTVDRADRSPFTSAKRIDHLSGGAAQQFDVQVERITAEPTTVTVNDAMSFDSVVEVQYDNRTYAGYAMLAVELVADEQLSSIPRVSVDVKGLANLRIWDGISSPSSPVFTTGYSANPADIALAILTNTVWSPLGTTYTDDNIVFSRLLEWRSYCGEVVQMASGGTRPRHAFNFVFDERRDAIDWLRTVCQAGRCVPSTIGNAWTFIHDRAQPNPIETFGDGDIVIDDEGVADMTVSYKYTVGGVSEANRLVAQIESDAQDGQVDTVLFPAEGEQWLATEPLREQTLRLDGVTSPDQAAAQLVYMLKKERLTVRTIDFATTKRLIEAQPGERIDVACRMMGWGVSGRVEAGSTASSVVLDREITLGLGATYTLTVSHLDNSIESRTISLAAGVYAAGEMIDVDGEFASTPEEGASYSVGESGIEYKPFIVTAIRPPSEAGGAWRIEAMEYNESVYDDDPGVLDTVQYSTLVVDETPPGPVTELRAYEALRQPTDGVTASVRAVELSWRQRAVDRLNTATFQVYRRSGGTTRWIPITSISASLNSAVIDLTEVDRVYEFTVIAVSRQGARLRVGYPTLPIARLSLGHSVPPPMAPTTSSVVQASGNTYDVSWGAVENAVGYEVLIGSYAPTSAPNTGSENCIVLAKTTSPELNGLKLAPGQTTHLWVRSVGKNGRCSFDALHINTGVAASPVGQTVKYDTPLDMDATGWKTNTAWNSGQLELVDPDSAGTWVSPSVDTGSNDPSLITMHFGTVNNHDDPDIGDVGFIVPSTEADQWGVVSDGPAVVSMLNPPSIAGAQSVLFEIATSEDDVAYTPWATFNPATDVSVQMRYFKVRVTLSRNTPPYQLAVSDLCVVVTS